MIHKEINPLSTPQATSSLTMWLDYLNHLHSSAIDLGLERIRAVAEHAGLMKPTATVITVAGTNGKGSSCALLEAILLEAGYKVGVYSSPHLIRYNERVRINALDSSEKQQCEAFDFINKKRGDISLSLFEFGTLAALRIFQVEAVDVILLEVGLGGRLDATNIIEHDVSLITSLAIDHTDWLGDDINDIGFEKAGIYRRGRPAICGEPNPPASVAQYAKTIAADFYQVGQEFDYQVKDGYWFWRGINRQQQPISFDNLPLPNLPLANAATILMALSCSALTVNYQHIVNGLRNASLPGRMQVLQLASEHHPMIMVDVAHNPHSADYLVKQLQKHAPYAAIHAVLGMLKDKDIKATVEVLIPVVTHWYLASLDGPRAASAAEINQFFTNDMDYVSSSSMKIAKPNLYSSPSKAFDDALLQAKPNELIIVLGSFHTVGEVLEHWQDIKMKEL